jgi:hypothetical protein
VNLSLCIEQIQENLKRGLFQNEASVSQGVVLKLLNALGWDTYDTQVVAPEYSVGGRRVDYALCHPASKPSIFIEVKQIGRSEGADKQLFEYAFHEGIPLAILTDGQAWHFYLPSGQGVYSERKFYFIDLLERDIDEICFRFDRYISYTNVKSGDARKNANNDYQDKSRQQEVTKIIPKAWHDLLAESDGLLIDLLSEKVEEICGYKPEQRTIEEFFLIQRNKLPSEIITPVPGPKPKLKPSPISQPQNPVSGIGYQYKGQWHSHDNGINVMLAILRDFSQSDRDFLARFGSRKHGRTRRWVDRSKSELYPGKPKLQEEHSRELIPGWWVGTNYSAISDMPKIIQSACEVMGIEYEKDLVARFR